MNRFLKALFTNHRDGSSVNERLWIRIAWIAGIFSALICVLMIANYAQIKKADPVNVTVINSLVERLSQNPSDTKLRDEIRTLDLLARKAYFTNRWQIKTGGYLLLAGVLVLIISLQVISLARKKDPKLADEPLTENSFTRKNARKWITIGGTALLVLALVLAWLTQDQLSDTINRQLTQTADSIITEPSAEANIEAGAIDSTASEQSTTIEQAGAPVSGEAAGITNTAVTATDNFPEFRGPGGSGIARQKNIPTSWDGKTGKNILWKTEIPLPGNNSPVIWGNKLFLTGADASKREVYCFDITTGKILWTAPVTGIQGSPAKAPTVSGETGHAAPTAATDGKSVFAIFSNGDLIALDMNGKKIWDLNLGMPQNHYGHSSSLLIYKNLLLIQFDQRSSARLLALSTLTGKTVWSTTRQVKVSWSSPILAQTKRGPEIILAAEPYVAGYNPENGEERWKLECISGEVGPSPAFANEIVFSVNDYSKLAAIKIGDTPEQLWESDEFLSDIPSPVATEKYLFLATSYGVAVCYDAVNGTKYWEKEFFNTIHASPVIADGKVFLLDRNGIMHIFKADKEFTIIAEPALGEKASATPAFTNGRIYLRADKNLYCIGK
ncbi:MAG: PQQ-binding-like beta-propeller repeat protein [Bacteroidales bacterium]